MCVCVCVCVCYSHLPFPFFYVMVDTNQTQLVKTVNATSCDNGIDHNRAIQLYWEKELKLLQKHYISVNYHSFFCLLSRKKVLEVGWYAGSICTCRPVKPSVSVILCQLLASVLGVIVCGVLTLEYWLLKIFQSHANSVFSFTGHHHRSWGTCWWQSANNPLWHRHVKVHLLWLLPGGLSCRCYCGGESSSDIDVITCKLCTVASVRRPVL